MAGPNLTFGGDTEAALAAMLPAKPTPQFSMDLGMPPVPVGPITLTGEAPRAHVGLSAADIASLGAAPNVSIAAPTGDAATAPAHGGFALPSGISLPTERPIDRDAADMLGDQLRGGAPGPIRALAGGSPSDAAGWGARVAGQQSAVADAQRLAEQSGQLGNHGHVTVAPVEIGPGSPGGGGGYAGGFGANVPGELQPDYGGRYYPPGYADMVMDAASPRLKPGMTEQDARAANLLGKPEMAYDPAQISPDQAKALLAQHAAWLKTPLGMLQQREQIQLGGEARQAQLDQQDIHALQLANERSVEAQRAAAEQEARIVEQQERMRVRYMAEQDKREQQIEKLNEEVRSTKINPDNYWSSRSGGAIALSVIGVALGAAGQMVAGGKGSNPALEMMNAAIERDIDAQKANLANKRNTLSDMRGVYSMARERFGDDNMAMNYARSQLWQQAAQQARAFAADARTIQLKDAALRSASDFETRAKLADQGVQEAAAQAAARAAMGSITPAAKAMSPEEQARTVVVQLPDGSSTTYQFGSSAEAEKARAKLTAASDVEQAIAELKQLGKAGLWRTPKYQAAAERARVAYAQAIGEKISSRNIDIMKEVIPDAPHVVDTGEANAWDEAARQARRAAMSQLAPHVVTPVATGVAPNKTGTAMEQKSVVLPQPQVRPGIAFRPVGAGNVYSDARLKNRARPANDNEQDLAIRALAAAKARDAMPKPSLAELALKAARMREAG